MILTAQPKQLSLKDEGQIWFQPDPTNPLPGAPIATVKKGETLLQPQVALLPDAELGAKLGEGETPDAATEFIATWLKAHIYTVLEPLFALVTDETLPEPVKPIALKLFAGTGIVPRGDIEDLIAALDPEGRKALRNKKVKLGPLLVFLPDLNRPAAVRLRAVLWSLFNDQTLPAPVPRDGAMSMVIDAANANADFYRAIGYPVYGPRAIRIDMLDRVISAVYDNAKSGKFQAKHQMAEWMGCPIADLYGILEAMGHKHISPPPKIEESVSEVKTEPLPVEEPKTEEKPEEKSEVASEVKPEKKEQVKPELDWFFLRRGKAHTGEGETPVRTERPPKKEFPKERFEPKKPFSKKGGKDEEGEGAPIKFHKKDRKDKDNGRDRGDRSRDGGKKPERQNEPRVFSAQAAPSDNPFAVLQNLKLK
jgi:ATP-dependent RNA helicase SUPV3L1/SUV3